MLVSTLVKILRCLLGLTFLFSAYTKFVAPGFFEITLIDQGLMPNRLWAQHAARFLIGFEFALGLLMLLPFYTKRLMFLSVLMLTGFSLHLAYLWATGDTENCGCFGEMISMSPAESILKNVAMGAIAVFVWAKSTNKTTSNALLWLFSLLAMGSMWLLRPISNASDFPFASFTQFEHKGRTDLASGEKIVAVFNLDCEHCQELATALADLQNNFDKFPDTYVLYFSEGQTTPTEFEALTQSRFPYAMIDVNTFFDLIGDSPPRLYHTKDAQVVNVWDTEAAIQLKKTFNLE